MRPRFSVIPKSTAIKLLAALVINVAVIAPAAHAGYADLIIDANTGKVLSSNNAEILNGPASLTKMMTLYLVFEALHNGRLSWDRNIVMTRNGAVTVPTKLGVPAGKTFTVREGVLGMIVKSANDAAEAVGDHLAGSEVKFGQMMTRKARQLGMKHTVFRNGSGLTAKGQVTTARDMAILAMALMRDFPNEYALFSTPSFSFRGKLVRGHNNLMYRYKGMDGIKTGYTDASGFNIVSAISAKGRRLVGVVLGGKTARSRDDHMAALLNAALPKASVKGITQLARASVKHEIVLPQRDVPLPVSAKRSGPVEVASADSDIASSIQASVAERADGRLGGWEIQIAAANSNAAAKNLLNQAQSALLGRYSEISPYTQAIKSNSTTLYRARFTGFLSQSSAASACEILKSKSYSCLIVPGAG